MTKYGRHVHLLVRGPKMKASKEMQKRTLGDKQITVHFNTECLDAAGNSKVRPVLSPSPSLCFCVFCAFPLLRFRFFSPRRN